MAMSQKSIQSMAVLVIIVFSLALCQENERRAVTEHQLLHDRGRTLQNLKRLMWLSSTMEGLHTAQTRAPGQGYNLADCRAEATLQFLSQLPKGNLLQLLWHAAHTPHLSELPQSEK